MKLLVFLFLSVTTLGVLAEIKPLIPYIDGKTACRDFEKTVLGGRIQVPIQYDQSQRGSSTLFYWFLEPYRPEKMTLLYVSGGPGESSHGLQDQFSSLRSSFNILQFHQRGVYCSRPETVDLINSNNYYSSEWTARDMELLRIHLQISKLIIWGHSYGTVPATIYGHLFPTSTLSLTLEGVLDKGSQRLWEVPSRRKKLHQFYKNLNPKLKAMVDYYSHHPDLDPRWFSIYSYNFSYYQNWSEMLFDGLQAIFSGTDAEILEGLKNFTVSESKKEDEVEFGHYAWTILTCKEFSASKPGANHYFTIENSDFIPDRRTTLNRKECRKRNILSNRFYQALDYPLQIPVTYLNGANDGATEADNALKHYEKVPKSQAQILIVENSGHVPFRDLNETGDFQPLFEQILRGELLSFSEIQSWNKSSFHNIQFQRKTKH